MSYTSSVPSLLRIILHSPQFTYLLSPTYLHTLSDPLSTMVLAKSLLWAVAAACSVSALPLINIQIDKTGISLAIAAKLNITGAANIIDADRTRAAKLKGLLGKRQSQGVQVSNTAVRLSDPPLGAPSLNIANTHLGHIHDDREHW